VDRRAFIAAVVAALATGEAVMAIDNPSTGLNQADVNNFTRTAESLRQAAAVFTKDPRYANEGDAMAAVANDLDRFREVLTNYLLVQGT
jgi:hypothetical protein